MKKTIIIAFLFSITMLNACKKDGFKGDDTSIPAVPVSVSNLFGTYNGVPTVSTSVAGGGAISITLSIPENSGRTIKEITRVGIASTPNGYVKVESVQSITATGGTYSSTPIPGKGSSVTFTTTLTEYNAKTGLTTTATPGGATTFLARYFLFLITLDNGDQIYPVGVRVYVDK